AKLYRRAPGQIAVSLPERRYETAARLLAAALQEAHDTGEPPRAVLDRRARELGVELGRTAGALLPALERLGFEPRVDGDAITLVNCPFHTLAAEHTELVCGMNLCLLTGLLDGLDATDVTASGSLIKSRSTYRKSNFSDV
ncbi:MAG: hypothetical protein HOY71_35900, partial [Nonomuraea sp.]|nr:hypothetical protein [Nonomuraea sp.]